MTMYEILVSGIKIMMKLIQRKFRRLTGVPERVPDQSQGDVQNQ